MTSIDPEMIAFIQLKVACNQAMQAPCKESIEPLYGLLNKLSSSSVQDMHSHLLFVLMKLLQQQQLRSEAKIQITECIETILSRVQLSTDEPILDSLLFCLMGIMYSPESDNLVTENPEELTLGCIKCLSLLLTQTKPKHRVQLYAPKRVSILGVLVCICLKQASCQQYRALKVAAIECLMACGQVLESERVTDPELRLQTANVFMNFIPGIAAGLQQVICSDEKQGHAITVVAVRAWGRLLAQVLDEEALLPEPSPSTSPPEISKCIPGSLSSARTSAELEHLMLKNQRSAAWFSHADTKLAGNVQAVCAVHLHSHFKVRLEMVHTAQLLLTKCSRAVPQCVPPLLEVLVTLSEDVEVQVTTAAAKALHLVAFKCESDSGKSLTEVMEESFFTLASQLPAIFNHADTRQQCSALGLLLGYLRLLGPRLPEALLLAPHCEALVQGLLQAVTLDCGTVLLLADSAVRGLCHGERTRPWCRFRHFADAEVQARLLRVCCLLGELADLPLLCGQLLQVFNEHPAQRREATFLLNQILSTVYRGKETEQFGVVRAVLRAYLDPGVWDVPLSVHDDESSPQNLTLAEVRGNVVQACLLTEGIATLTVATGPLARQMLAQVLYPVLERTGSPLELVSGAGRLALGQLAFCLGHTSTAQLIRNEADYFLHTVEMRLRRPRNNPGALLVLSAILTHSSSDILPSIYQVVSNVLVRSCATVQECNLTAYLQVFHTFVVSVRKWLDEEREGEKRNLKGEGKEKEEAGQQAVQSLLIQELCLHQKWKLTTGEEDIEEEVGEEDAEGSALESEETVVPNYVRMTEAVMLRCVHALPSQDRERQLIALATLNVGVQILALHEDQLLPMVHRIWSPLLQRFSPNQDIVVLRESFELLCTMAHSAKNFLRNRALDKVLPSITSFLMKQSTETRKQRCQLYRQSVKLQKVALDRLGGLAADLELQEEHLELVLTAASPYLSAEQPPALQESCLGLFRSVAKISPDIVWLQLRTLWNPAHELLPPHPSCPVIRLPRSTLDAVHFKKNVEVLQLEV